jgi:hypothetical protein
MLIGEKAEHARIEIPYRPPDEYDFRIVFMRFEGIDSIVQHLSKSEHPFVWNMDAAKNTASALELVNGKPAHDNETTFKGELIKDKLWHTSIVQVRNSGIAVLFDGKPFLKFATTYENLSYPPGWKLRDISVLGLGHWTNKAAFSTVEVVEITGSGKKTR